MLALPPPPLPPPSSSTRKTKPVSLDQIVISKQPPLDQLSLESSTAPNSATTKLRRPPTLLRQPRFQRTNPIIWLAAVLCLIFSLVLIFFGVATLIIFLAIKPRSPTFDIPNANLNAVYFDSPDYINGDITLLANFTNPNSKIDVSFESLDVELFFSDRIISAQSIQPFTQRRRESRLQSLHFISSLVFLPKDLGVKLLHSRCQIEMTGPPTGVLVARKCITKR